MSELPGIVCPAIQVLVALLIHGEDSSALISVLHTGLTTEEAVEDALRQYFKWLKDAAGELCADSSSRYHILAVTNPNYFGADEKDRDIDKFFDYYWKWADEFFPYIKERYPVSEGQAICASLTSAFSDAMSSTRVRKLQEVYSNRVSDHSLNLLVVDLGGSSLNLQMQNCEFDKLGRLLRGQSSTGPGIMTGM